MVGTGESVTHPGEAAAGQPAAGVQPYYVHNAGSLGLRYESVTFEDVHGGVTDLLPQAPARVLDIGSGTGRDAAALALRGYQVVAAEPVRELREVAQRLHAGEYAHGIRWAEDSLPELARLEGSFELVLLSAVWMHLPLATRGQAMHRLAELLAPSGLLVISLRRGAPPSDRVMFDVPAEEVVRHGQQAGLGLVRLIDKGADHLCRAEVWWQTVALRKDEETE